MPLQVLVNGLLLGGLYAAVGVGFSLVWGVMNLINIAHGAFFMLGSYTTYWMFTVFGIDPFLSLPLAAAVPFVIAYLIQRFIINRVINSGVFMILILTFGINLLLINVAMALWKSDYRSITPAYAGTGLELGSVIIPWIRLAIFVIAIVATLLLHLWLTYSRTGQAIRATALNRVAASLYGVDVMQIYPITFAIGGALAGMAGGMGGMLFAITPEIGAPFIGKAFIIACLGGLGSMTGAVAGGLLLALAETVGGYLIGPTYQQAIASGILVLVLVISPEGLLGKKFFAEIK